MFRTTPSILLFLYKITATKFWCFIQDKNVDINNKTAKRKATWSFPIFRTDKPSLNPLKKDSLSVRNIGKPKVAFLFAVLLLKSQFYYPGLGQRTKCTPSSLHVIATAFVYLEYKQNSSSKSNQSYRQYPVDSLTRNCIPCLVKGGKKSYPVQQYIPVKAILVCTPPPPPGFLYEMHESE